MTTQDRDKFEEEMETHIRQMLRSKIGPMMEKELKELDGKEDLDEFTVTEEEARAFAKKMMLAQETARMRKAMVVLWEAPSRTLTTLGQLLAAARESIGLAGEKGRKRLASAMCEEPAAKMAGKQEAAEKGLAAVEKGKAFEDTHFLARLVRFLDLERGELIYQIIDKVAARSAGSGAVLSGAVPVREASDFAELGDNEGGYQRSSQTRLVESLKEELRLLDEE